MNKRLWVSPCVPHSLSSQILFDFFSQENNTFGVTSDLADGQLWLNSPHPHVFHAPTSFAACLTSWPALSSASQVDGKAKASLIYAHKVDARQLPTVFGHRPELKK